MGTFGFDLGSGSGLPFGPYTLLTPRSMTSVDRPGGRGAASATRSRACGRSPNCVPVLPESAPNLVRAGPQSVVENHRRGQLVADALVTSWCDLAGQWVSDAVHSRMWLLEAGVSAQGAPDLGIRQLRRINREGLKVMASAYECSW